MAKVVIVTGGTKGIGKAISLKLVKSGFHVVVNYSNDDKAANETLNELNENATLEKGDVSRLDDMEKLFKKASQIGELYGVVHSAGILKYTPIADLNLDAFDKMININLRGSYIVLGLAAKTVISGGRIIALSTSVIARNPPNYGPYVASKMGVEGLVHTLANELRGKNITVNAVAPGPVATDLFFNGKSPELIEQMKKWPPLERLGEPEDISGVVLFLLSPEGYWVNSQVVRVNGGYA